MKLLKKTATCVILSAFLVSTLAALLFNVSAYTPYNGKTFFNCVPGVSSSPWSDSNPNTFSSITTTQDDESTPAYQITYTGTPQKLYLYPKEGGTLDLTDLMDNGVIKFRAKIHFSTASRTFSFGIANQTVWSYYTISNSVAYNNVWADYTIKLSDIKQAYPSGNFTKANIFVLGTSGLAAGDVVTISKIRLLPRDDDPNNGNENAYLAVKSVPGVGNPWSDVNPSTFCTTSQVLNDLGQNSYQFTYTATPKDLYLYFSPDQNYNISEFKDKGIIKFRAKVNDASSNPKLYFGVRNAKTYKKVSVELTVTANNTWQDFTVKLSDLRAKDEYFDWSSVRSFVVFATGQSVGDVVSISQMNLYTNQYDPSAATQPLGTTQSWPSPYCEIGGSQLSVSVDTTNQFLGRDTWKLAVDGGSLSNYKLTFYTANGDPLTLSDFVDNGFLEFYVRANASVTLPVAICSINGSDSSTYREYVVDVAVTGNAADWQTVKIPLRAAYDAGVDLNNIRFVRIQGTNTLPDDLQVNIFGFDFYSDKHLKLDDQSKNLTLKLEQNHPGVAEMDAKYRFNCYKNGYPLASNAFTLTTTVSGVTISGNTVTVPYSLRQSQTDVPISVYQNSDNTYTGSYTLTFTETWTSTFEDNFDTLNTSVWKDGWMWGEGNAYSTADDGKVIANNNCTVENGKLVVGAYKRYYYVQSLGQYANYVSSCISTINSFTQKYGCFTAKVQMPAQGGVNAAFWLGLPAGEAFAPNPYAVNDNDGEVDIVEYGPSWGNQYSTDTHFWGYSTWHSHESQMVPSTSITTGYHEFSVVWTEDTLYYYYDGDLVRTYTGYGVPQTELYPIFQLALGTKTGTSWVGNFNDTMLPLKMYVDYVKVYS